MSYLTIGSERIFYEVHGSGAPLLILPGNTASSAHLHLMGDIAYFSQFFRVIVMDYRGTGKSSRCVSWPRDWFCQSAKDTNCLLQHLRIERCSLLGSSGGAFIAFWMAVMAPATISDVIADSFNLDFPAHINAVIASTRTTFQPQQIAFWQAGHGVDWRQVIDADTAFLRQYAMDHPTGTVDIPLERVKQPVLLCGSRQDDLIPDLPAQLQRACARLENCQLYVHDTGGHPWMWSQTDVFRQKALAFLRQTERC